MNKSLYTKLVTIIIVLILSLMTVVGAFLMRGVRNFYVFAEQKNFVNTVLPLTSIVFFVSSSEITR